MDFHRLQKGEERRGSRGHGLGDIYKTLGESDTRRELGLTGGA